jgi:hypothetical protein
MAFDNPIPQASAIGQVVVQPRSWLGRNWKWLLAVAFLGCIVFAVGIFALIMGVMRNSDVAQQAVARAQANPAVVQQLGAGIDEGWMMSGSVNEGTGGSGDAQLAVPISGSKGKAIIYVVAHKEANTWNYSHLVAVMGGSGEKIDLLAASSPTSPGPALATPAPIATPSPIAAPAAAAAAPADAPPVPASSSSSAPPASTDGDIQGVRIAINELKRTSDTLTLKFTVFNTSAASFSLNGAFDNDPWHRYADLRGVYLLDSHSKKKYFVVTDSDGNYLSSSQMASIAPGSQATVWAKFPPPPDDVKTITVAIPHFIPLEDIPVSR